MAKTRRNGRGIASRVFHPVGEAVNAAGNIVKTGFKAAKNIGQSVVKGANKVIANVGRSISNSRRGRKGRATRRR